MWIRSKKVKTGSVQSTTQAMWGTYEEGADGFIGRRHGQVRCRTKTRKLFILLPTHVPSDTPGPLIWSPSDRLMLHCVCV